MTKMVRTRKRNWLQIGLGVLVLGVGLLITFIAGLWWFMSATATPLHPDPATVPSVTRSVVAPSWVDAMEQGRQLVRASLVEQNLPGVSVAVGVGGGIVWAEGFGYADLETRAPVTPDTQFRIGEVSIPLTSAAVGLLLERGELSLDEQIQRYVPEFPEKAWPVTLRQLMAHQAGVRTDAGDEEPILVSCERTTDALPRFASSDLLFEPGTRVRRSTYGWILVSAAVESVASETFQRFMRTQIFEPLGMVDTRPDRLEDALPNRSTFYFPRFAGDPAYGPDVARPGDHSCFSGAGMFLSTASDLVRFGMAFSTGTVVTPATVQLLQAPQRLTSGEETAYGLGWELGAVSLDGASIPMAGHGTKADFMGGTMSLMTVPDRDLVIVVASNISFADTKAIAVSLAEVFGRPSGM